MNYSLQNLRQENYFFVKIASNNRTKETVCDNLQISARHVRKIKRRPWCINNSLNKECLFLSLSFVVCESYTATFIK